MRLLSWTQLSDFPFTFHSHALEKEMATHSSVLAWGIPGTGVPVQEHENIFEDTFKNIARHFAEWQKEQMMKGAIDGRLGYGPIIGLNTIPTWYGGLRPEKVKVIVIKEE